MTRSIRYTLALFTFLPFFDVLPQPILLNIRKEDSHIGFSVTKWAVFKEEGRFRDFEGTITFDPNDFSATKVELTIQAASIDSRNESRDQALRSREFFNVAMHPRLTFHSTAARPLDATTFEIEGDITIRGKTKRITAPVKVLGINHTGRSVGTLVGFDVAFTLNREDFRIGEGWDIIGRSAEIILHIGSSTAPATARR